MDKLISDFKNSRNKLIEAVNEYPVDKREDKLFGEWNLKDVVVHFAAWDSFFTQMLKLHKQNKTVPYWEDINKFNDKEVGKKRSWSWDKVYNEFIQSGDEFIKEYSKIPKNLLKKLFWTGRAYTPEKILKVNIHHYQKAQYIEILKLLRMWRSI
jgi:uncharacterized damage-inducible protein DinB